MTLLNQHHQADVSPLTPMPCDRVDDTSVNNTSTSETLVWYYSNSGTRAAAAGQAAGTMCEAKTTYTGILNSSGSAIGCKDDTSLSFAAATRASTLVRVPEDAFSKMLDMTYAEKVAYMATWLDTNGDYAIDHRRGQIWCLMKATAANDAVTYVYATTLSGGGTGDKVDIIKVGGTATLIQNAAFGTATPMIPIAAKYMATPTTYDDGDAVPILTDANGRIALSSDIEIGAVEIKNGLTDDRAEVVAPNSKDFDFGLHVMPARYVAAPADVTDTYSTPILTDIKGRVQVTAAADIPTTLTGGSKTVTTAGTAEALGTSLATKSIYIRAKAANTSFVCVGDSSVDEATNQQIVLYANDSVTLNIANRATVYVDVDVNLEGVDYLAMS